MTFKQASLPNEAMHRMSGTHARLRFGSHGTPLIGDLNRSTLEVRMRSARKVGQARRWRPRQKCGEPASGSWRAWRPLREAKTRTWSDRYRKSCECESTRPTGWRSHAKGAKPAKMREPKSNQALEPTEIRVSVLDMAALLCPMVSGLRGSARRSALRVPDA
jgi:hypothetical protein